MARTKGGPRERKRHAKVLKMARGFRGRRRNTFRAGNQAVERALQYAYAHRRLKKRTFRSLWIQRINAGVRENGLIYSQFIHGLKLANIELDRKVLSDIAALNPQDFALICKQVSDALDKAKKAA
ncbi:MAG: 50S ribosomal protein L20 [Alphaproteobacteria bacterium]|nr:50S ribosomal protein L20 [Alphaproteobacteria bacterium]MBU0859829.1 50S ribosomal protein L20 [Alphaproteobacteria bacterium]